MIKNFVFITLFALFILVLFFGMFSFFYFVSLDHGQWSGVGRFLLAYLALFVIVFCIVASVFFCREEEE
jgi:hypothetical protein